MMTVYRASNPMLTGFSGTNTGDAIGAMIYFVSNFMGMDSFYDMCGTIPADAPAPGLPGLTMSTICKYLEWESPADALVSMYDVQVNTLFGVYQACNLKGVDFLHPQPLGDVFDPSKLSKPVRPRQNFLP